MTSDVQEETVTPEVLLAAYRQGFFPMADARDARGFYWYAPRARGILPIPEFHMPRRLRDVARAGRYRVTFNAAFTSVVLHCASHSVTGPRRETWINDDIIALYAMLHAQGDAHSVEIWHESKDELLGGLYGLAIGGTFFGESMFSRARDMSKLALSYTAAHLLHQGFTLFDTQYINPHLLQFGGHEIAKGAYKTRLNAALDSSVTFIAAPGTQHYGSVPTGIAAADIASWRKNQSSNSSSETGTSGAVSFALGCVSPSPAFSAGVSLLSPLLQSSTHTS